MKELLKFVVLLVVLLPTFALMFYSIGKIFSGEMYTEFTDCGKITNRFKEVSKESNQNYYKFIVQFDSLGHKEMNVTIDTFLKHSDKERVCFSFDHELFGWNLFFQIIGCISIVVIIIAGIGFIGSRMP
jgi:uncharacterized membrane protein